MSFIDRLVVGTPSEKRDFQPGWDSAFNIPRPWEDPWLTNPSDYVGGGEWVSENLALQLNIVFACIRTLSDVVSAQPLKLFRDDADGFASDITQASSLAKKPHLQLTPFEWKWQVVSSMAARGNAYLYIANFDRFEYPTDILPIHPDEVDVFRNRDTGLPEFKVGGVFIEPSRIVHIKRFPLAGSIKGISPIGAMRLGIGLGLAAERYGARFFADSANPSSVLETEQELDDDQVRKNQESWIRTHGGRRLPAVLSGGFKWKPITIMPDEAQFLQTRKYQRGEIASWYGIPPHMVGDTDKSTSWGTGIEQQSTGFVRFNLTPWVTCIEEALTEITPRGQYFKFDLDALQRGDKKSRYESYMIGRQSGFLNVDEIRREEGMRPVPDGAGTDYLQPMNMVPLGTPPPEPAAPAAPTETEPEEDSDVE